MIGLHATNSKRRQIKIALSVIFLAMLAGLMWGLNLYNQYSIKINNPENHDYWDRISAFTLGMNLRFDKSVNVYLGGFNEGEQGERCKKIMKESFVDWENVLAGKLNVSFIDDRENSDIEITENNCPGDFMSDIEKVALRGRFSGEGCLGGSTMPAIKNRGLYIKIEVQCRTASGALLNEGYLKGLYLHEAGHSLGMQYHSNYSGDVMHPAVTNLDFSQSDIRTIRHVYDKPASVPPWILIKSPYVSLIIISAIAIVLFVRKRKVNSNS